MHWNPIEVTGRVWPMRYGPPLLILAWLLWIPLILGGLLLAAHVAIKAVSPQSQIPFLAQLVNWYYFGYALFGDIVIAVVLGLGLAFRSATVKQEMSGKSSPTTSIKETFVKDDKDIRITSINQQGGITAYQVNVQPGDRVVNAETAKALEETLKTQKFTSIRVTSVMGDGEALQFASQIKAYLESKGYKVSGVNQAMYSGPVRGQTFMPAGADGILHIRIGTH